MESSRTPKHWLYTALGLLALSGITFFFGLGSLPLIGPDEPRYAEVAREMFASGDYISPRLCGHLWFEKPVLLYWMQAAAYHAFGVNEFAARFPSALAALLTLAFLCHALWRLISPRLAVIVACVLATTAFWFAMARGATTDMVLASTISLAVMSGYLSLADSGRKRWMYWLLCAAATGLAMLAKGLIGILLVTAILGIYGTITRHFSFRTFSRHWPKLLGGCLLFLLVISTWYVPVTLEHGRTFIDEFFINHHFKRYLTNEYHHSEPIYFFLFVAFAGSIPWTFFLIPALGRLRSLRPRSDCRDSLLVLAWVWFIVPVVFFSLSTSKLPSYILPVFPALSIIIGMELERICNGERTRLNCLAMGLTALLLVCAGAAFVVYSQHQSVLAVGWQAVLYWGPWIVGVMAAAAFVLNQSRALLLGTPAVVVSIVVGAVALLFPMVPDSISLKPLSVRVASVLKPGEEIAFYRKDRTYAPVFYDEGRIVFYDKGRILHGIAKGDELDAETPADLLLVLQRERREGESSLIVITKTKLQRGLQGDTRFHTEIIGHQNDLSALRVALRVRAGLTPAREAAA